MHLEALETRTVPALSVVSSSFSPDHWRITFDAQVDARSLDWSDFRTFAGPGGNLDGTLNGFAVVKPDKRQVDVFFDDQTVAGTYSIVVGPGIASRAGDGMASAVNLTGTITATPGAVFTDSFGDGVIDSRWSVKGSGGAWVESGGVVSQTSTANGDPKKLELTGVTTAPNAAVRSRVRVDAWSPGDGARAGVGVLTDAGGLGYNLLFREGGIQFLDDYVRWGNYYSFAWSVGVWYNFKLTSDAGTLKGKVWADGTPEPADWQFTQAGWTTHTAGSVALNGGSAFAGNGSCTVSFDDVAVYDATPAPSPPPPPPPPPPAGGFHIDLQLTGFTASQQLIFRQAADRWAQVIVGDLPDATFNGIPVDDLLIQGTSQAIDGQGGVLGSAGPDRLRLGSLLPYHGSMTFDSADMAWLESSGNLFNTILHEMSHVLGLGTTWGAKGLLTGAGGSDPQFIGAKAVAAYSFIFGTNAVGVPVENIGGSGTRDSHWRESIFGSELATGFLNGAAELSSVTVAQFEDLGYQVSYDAADFFMGRKYLP